MRVAYISTDLGVPVCGRKGCSIHVQEVVRGLARQGIRVDLFSTNIEGSIPDGFDNVILHRLARPPKADQGLREAATEALNGEWVAALEQEGPYDFVYERYSLWSAAGMAYAQAKGVPGVLEVNSPLIQEQATYRVLLDHESAQRLTRNALEAASVVLAVSDEVAAYLHTFPEARQKVHVVPNGVDAERFCVRPKREGLAVPGVFTIGFVGGLKPWHGLSNLVSAFAEFCRTEPKGRLLIVGDGPELGSLVAQLSQENLLEKAQLTGALPHSQVPDMLAAMDVAVAPYPNLANFYFSPLKVYEYMAAGLSVVASNIGQLPQIIRHGVDGLLVAPGDPRALAEALLALAKAPLWREQLGAAARARICRGNTWDEVVNRIVHLASL